MTDRVTETAADAPAAGTGREAPQAFLALSLGSVGVVYGDIGTSPLYAFREAVAAASHSQGVTREIVLGVLGIIVVLVAGTIWRKRTLQKYAEEAAKAA